MKCYLVLILIFTSLAKCICQNLNYSSWQDVPAYSLTDKLQRNAASTATLDFFKNKDLAKYQSGVVVRNKTNYKTNIIVKNNDKENWYPVSKTKTTLCGKLEKFGYFDGRGEELDWTLYVMPDSIHQHMIDDAIQLKESLWEEGYKTKGAIGPKVKVGKTSLKFWWPKGGGRARKKKSVSRSQVQIEGEITPKKSIAKKGNPFGVNFCIRNPVFGAKKTDITIGMYGPFVIEKRHNYRPEIHPCEAIWWKENGILHLFSSHDESGRFQVYQDSILEHEWRIPFQIDAASEAIHFSIKIADSKNPIGGMSVSQKRLAVILVDGHEKASAGFSATKVFKPVNGIEAVYFEQVGKLVEDSSMLLGELVIVVKAGYKNESDRFGQMHLEVSRTINKSSIELE